MVFSVDFLYYLYFGLYLKIFVFDVLSLFIYSYFVWYIILVYISLINSLKVY